MLFSIFATLGLPLLAAAQWPRGPGDVIKPQAPNYDLKRRLKAVDVDRIRKNVEKLVSFDTRSTVSSQTDPDKGIGAATNWMLDELRSYGGNLNVSTVGYIQEPAAGFAESTPVNNVVAMLTGSENPDRVYVISGHLDSRNSDLADTTGLAPGANDDASGVSALMELARVFASTKPKASIMFVAVSGEEQGYVGSAYLAKLLKDMGKDVQGMLNNDIVGSPVAQDGSSDPDIIRMFVSGIPPTASPEEIETYIKVGADNDSPSRQLGKFILEVADPDVTGINIGTVYRQDGYLRKGDHTNFLLQGFPVARFTQPNLIPSQIHQDVRMEDGIQYGDLIEYVDYEYLTKVARVNGAAIFSLADGPGTPKDVTIDLPGVNDSTLRWTVDTSVAGYEVVWRPTDAAQWTHAISLGCVGEATIKLSKDNVFFGVRAVGTNGKKSPATGPLPAK